MTGARVVFILAALSPFCFAAIVLIGAVRRLRSRGEEAGTPERACTCEDCDDLMAIADAVAADLDAEDWQLWERQMARAEQ